MTRARLAPAPTPQNTYPTAGSEGTPTFHTVPYPTVHAYPVASTPMAVASSGPVSGSIQVPARPKPGRKAATDEPENKRKAQNRQAQRAFRDRKQQQAETLDKTNQELREMNEKLRTEFRAIQAKFEKNQQELQREHDAAIQRAKDFENKFQNSIPMLNELHAKVEALQMELREAYIKNALSLPQNGPVTGSAVGAPTTEGIQPTFGSTTQGYTGEQRGAVLSGVPQKRHIATDGCGDCEENGACACVDSYVVEVPQPILRAQDSALSRQLSTSSMSIHSLLSPDAASSGQGESDVPELVNDHSSPEELETEFTYVSVGRDATQSCGFCGTDRSNCLCADTAAAKGDRPTLASYGSGPAQTLMGPPKIKPGSCVECQQNPEQKAYCEQLAQEREQDRAQPDGQPAAKRPRSNRNNPSVPCASAFQLYKHYSGSGNNRTPSYDEIYQDLTASNPGSQRGTGIQGMERHRQFSAFETDIATVIANLRHHDSSSASSQSMNRVDNADNSNPSSTIDNR
ncbi:hypothetical protein EJ08DRAFT_3240 [Tothia fuscella]|uniref:BZIP domain-containing protein n=1 Tax=Tothia fuscella TaxID=1048955 RepID=A0A9P4P5B1_9PEZI|nr:hypothetical protein EJ08DRAFT_3240 [Tothia fuscella]